MDNPAAGHLKKDSHIRYRCSMSTWCARILSQAILFAG